MIRVLLVDDQPLIRTAVRAILSSVTDLDVVGEAADGAAAVHRTRELLPDVVLMDIQMPGGDGIHATREICADPDLARVRVLILTTFEEDANVVEALRAGASGFVGKGIEPAELAGAIRVVHAGESLLSPSATSSLIRRYLAPEPDTAPIPELEQLTTREREILRLVARGLSNDEIAAQLFISTSTAKTHINRTMAKLGVHDRAQLVVIAYESGLQSPRRKGPGGS